MRTPESPQKPQGNVDRTTTRSAALTTAIHLDSVSKIYGTFAALRNITATIESGTCTVIFGENGAGKSTLLRVVAGLITPTRGSVSVLGGSPHQQSTASPT